MFEGTKVAIVGEAGLCLAWKAMGLNVFPVAGIEEARAALEIIEDGEYALCLIHESYLEPLKEERKRIGEKVLPVIVGFSDYRKVPEHLEAVLREMSVRAVGSDFLLKRKEDNETR